MLLKPFLALCSNRVAIAKQHPTSFPPEDWFSDSSLVASGSLYNGIEFDFFVNWTQAPIQITPVIWVKRILQPAYTYAQVIENLKGVLIAEFTLPYLIRIFNFCNTYHFQLQIVIFRDDYNWSNTDSSILLITITAASDNGIECNSEQIDIETFKERIRNHSGGAVTVGQKGLIYGTSKLECFLSTTNSAYPGDVDKILLDVHSGKPKAILEFKKHTLNSPIEEQRLGNYYPGRDSRKYDRLAVLRDYISRADNSVPIIIVYYPTNPAFNEGKVELIQGEAGHLKPKAQGMFYLPENNSLAEFRKPIEKMDKAVKHHYALTQ